ncbi:hypothetical protein EsH8_IV_000192 [Colletotrichum jinshuiense]
MAAIRFLIFLACFVGLGNVVAGADVSYAGIPSCAINCILQEIGHSSCSLTNQTCICNDTVLAGYVETCVLANCTVKESLSCGVPMAQKDTVMKWFRAVLFGLPTFFIVVRVSNKWMKLSSWGWDDATIIGAYIVLAAFLPAAYLAEDSGAGRDIWTLKPDQITQFLLLFLIFGMLYMTCIALIKSSILFLYLRIFPDERFRKILWCTQVFNLLLWISFISTTFASCQPLNFFWNGWTKETEGKCFNLNAFAMCHGAINVALDFWILILPSTQVLGLRMQLKRKIGVLLMFGVGIFLTAVSAYRIKALLIFATSYNLTADSFQSSLWSHIELCVGIFVACLPSTRQLWRTIFPKILEVTHISKTGKSVKGSNYGSNNSRTLPVHSDRQQQLSYEESSIAHLVGGLNRADLNDTSPTEDDFPRTPKSQTEMKLEHLSPSSRGS